jgi:hypothetical protein
MVDVANEGNLKKLLIIGRFSEKLSVYLTDKPAWLIRGYRVLVKNKKEPWGQIVSRFLSPEGLLVGISFTPAFREPK